MSERFGLPPDKVPAFQDSFHGLALRAGQLTAANCASCHGVHDIRPSSDPRSHVNKTNLPATCGKCHPGAGTRFALGPVHVSATANFPLLFGIRIIYLWLIGLTIGFMIVHNALDLIHKSRHPSEMRPFAITGEVPERMSRSLRWQHGLIMVSFPVLAYTGFALTYPESLMGGAAASLGSIIRTARFYPSRGGAGSGGNALMASGGTGLQREAAKQTKKANARLAGYPRLVAHGALQFEFRITAAQVWTI
jgi:hypothetical protein